MTQTEKNVRIALHEDWVVVILGFLVIGAALLHIIPAPPSYSWSNAGELTAKILTGENFYKIGIQFVFVLSIAGVGYFLNNKPLQSFLTIVFPVLYVLTIIALIISGYKGMKDLGLEAVIFSLLIGLLIRNILGVPEWFRSLLNGEVFVKIGLVLLGTSVIFRDILKAGSLGLIQALLVVVSVWYFAYWLCRKLKIDDELSLMISSAVSICGVSAAIATAGAIKGDTKKLSYVVSLVLVTAIPMMIFMPLLANYLGLSQEETGAWLGGTIDTTGAVVASGSLVGEVALKISTIVKFSQNVLLGAAAFAISIYWSYNKNAASGVQVEKPTLNLIWERFPKFVLGFVAASILFSFILSSDKVAEVKDGLKNIQLLWFALAFTSIGLETKFSDLFSQESKKPLIAFLIAQSFNIVVTLIIAVLLFN
ncbi:MAG: YeiH family protein [Cytophaga sp.]|uniref:YeiH family protein n=1 Tax=Cytophaga sp. TaxID=29535 RepID=UPI003F7CFE4E